MAGELTAQAATGQVLYAILLDANGKVWNGTSFDNTPTAGEWATYDIAMTEDGSTSFYRGDMPAVAAGIYEVRVFIRTGATPTPPPTDILVWVDDIPFGGAYVTIPTAPDCALATVADLKAHMGSEATGTDAAFQRSLNASQRWIENRICGRKFCLIEGEILIRYPNVKGTVDVTDLINVISIKVDTLGDRQFAGDNDELAATDYELFPYVDRDGSPSVRWQEVGIHPRSSRSFYPDRLVRIEYDRGFVEAGNLPPDDVVQAHLMRSAELFKRKEMTLAVAQMPAAGFKRVTEQDQRVLDLLRPYKHPRFKRAESSMT